MAQRRRIYCKFCDFFCYTPDDFVVHIEKKHDEMIPEDQTPWQFSYYLRTGKDHGNCVVCKQETGWNESTHKYNRFCDNPRCKEKYREEFKKRMIGKYGKTTLLNDPDQQRKMLANRKISGKYLWSDRAHEIDYTGTYEKSFLEFLDHVLEFDPDDIMSPSPHTYYYKLDEDIHFYIPDFFIPSLELEVEIKDENNTHPNRINIDGPKERAKDEVMSKNHYNYLKIKGKNNELMFTYLEKAKLKDMNQEKKPIIML